MEQEEKTKPQIFITRLIQVLLFQSVLSLVLWLLLSNQSLHSLKVLYGYTGMIFFALVGMLVAGRWHGARNSHSEVLKPSLERNAQDIRESFKVSRQALPWLTASMITMIASSL